MAPSDPWHRDNLYSAESRSYYIPLALFTGERWDGRKIVRHPDLNYRDSYNSRKGGLDHMNVQGPKRWKHPYTGALLQVYEFVIPYKNSLQRMVIRDDGVNLVYQKSDFNDHYFQHYTQFPLGAGWRLKEKHQKRAYYWKAGDGEDARRKRRSAITLLEMNFDSQNRLQLMVYEQARNRKKRFRYTYRPNEGLVAVQ